VFATLHAAATVARMDLPGFRLHPLKGDLKGFWGVTVRANWRVIFRFDGGPEDVDYVDYHWRTTHDDEKPAAPRRRCVA
jgi:proteic killer suppression protein